MTELEDKTTPEIPQKEKLLQMIEDLDEFQARLVLSFIATLFQG